MPRGKPSKTDILFVSHSHFTAGGGEKALLEMVVYLSKRGLKVHVIVGTKDSLTKELSRHKIPFTTIPQPWWAHGPQDTSPFIYSGPDPTGNITLATVELIKKLRPKLCATNTLVTPWLAYAAAMTATKHVWIIHELGTTGLNLRYAIGEKQTFATVDILSDAIFYNSKLTAEYYIPHFHRNTIPRIIYPGGSVPKPTPVVSPFRESAFKLIAVGQIKPQKGQFDAVRAVKKLRDKGKDLQLIIIGADEDPIYANNLRQYVKQYQLHDSVIFAGYQINPASFVALSDTALTCSSNDAFGRVTVEAMLLEKPVIGARSGGTVEIIDDNETGLLYTPGDAQDLAKKIGSLMSDPGLVRQMGVRAKVVATNRYSDAVRYAGFLEYFRNLADEKKSLDMSPLLNVFTDFQATIDLLRERDKRLGLITNSVTWRLLRSVRRLLPK